MWYVNSPDTRALPTEGIYKKVERKKEGKRETRADHGEHCVHEQKAFCESGGPGRQNGNEVTFLPPIVESAESSPAAAAACARLIRKFLKKDYWSNSSYQYNALMLTRILSDNPGPSFTRNLDDKFVDVLRDLLRNGRDLSVRQMLMETLDSFENQKGWDEGLAGCIEMWRKEKEKAYKAYGGRAPPPQMPMMGGAGGGAVNQHLQNSQNYFSSNHHRMRLPNPAELASRLEEARTSAKLLTQVVANTPSTEVIDNDLVKEFADRCLSASRSIQHYMAADNPGPDNETMETLIDVNEELQRALNNQKRAVLSARKELGIDGRSQDPSPPLPETNGSHPPSLPGSSNAFAGAPPRRRDNGKGKARQSQVSAEFVSPPSGPPPGRPDPVSSLTGLVSPVSDDEDGENNPFRDPEPAGASSSSYMEQPSLDYEPFHPGFSQPTQSYLGRQESALDKIQMSGAGSGSLDRSRDEQRGGATNNYSNYRHNGGSAAAAAGSSSSSSAAVPRPRKYEYEEDEEGHEDVYNGAAGASSSGKQPANRY
ncbi:hypothetical protein M406DRAFT_51727 [Cryphonectria parasitica EP155]|uniref:GAT domain-containing protein n=1 Tax=Cryphonectria parasitica (strain ATCC 38755 / EP155) TaxID=660469 RepID=A0A9P4XSE2_CRYP1|nr:uncharacterized protein M406DRAFT_51727 [Cryphonectria parasitica EP155]KAF3760051.1 hypothetical protein M406DRAFT_51727 [Cryphonectria parasitica EP155]